MRALREQFVFRAGYQVNDIKSELVIYIGNTSPSKKPSLVNVYYWAITRGSVKRRWTLLFGVANLKFELIPQNALAWFQEVKDGSTMIRNTLTCAGTMLSRFFCWIK
jgi:hypothetical protein